MLKRARHRLPERGALAIQKMEAGGERVEIGREAHHGGVVQSGSDTGEHKDKTVDGEKDGQCQVQVYDYILCICAVLSSN